MSTQTDARTCCTASTGALWSVTARDAGFGPRSFYERTVPEEPEGIGAILETAAGDLDGDGRDDLVLAQDDKIDVLRSGLTGVPGSATPHELAFQQRGVAVGDVDGDQRPDIATADSSGAVVVLRNRGLRPQSVPTLVGAPVLIGADDRCWSRCAARPPSVAATATSACARPIAARATTLTFVPARGAVCRC